MSVTQTLYGELQRIGTVQGLAQTVAFVHDGRRIELELVELNSLACAFLELNVTDPALASADMPSLQAISAKLCARLNYLLEPIQPIEIDAEQCTVQMRSNPPAVDDDQTSYYELLVKKSGVVSLVRYGKQPGDARRVIPAEVTRAVLTRLVNDLAAASQL